MGACRGFRSGGLVLLLMRECYRRKHSSSAGSVLGVVLGVMLGDRGRGGLGGEGKRLVQAGGRCCRCGCVCVLRERAGANEKHCAALCCFAARPLRPLVVGPPCAALLVLARGAVEAGALPCAGQGKRKGEGESTNRKKQTKTRDRKREERRERERHNQGKDPKRRLGWLWGGGWFEEG